MGTNSNNSAIFRARDLKFPLKKFKRKKFLEKNIMRNKLKVSLLTWITKYLPNIPMNDLDMQLQMNFIQQLFLTEITQILE